jgi:hypothetical protein
VHYTDGYPDTLPDLSLEAIEGELEDDELESLLHELRTIVRIVYLAAIPSLIQKISGRGKSGDGHDIHASFSSERKTLTSSSFKSREYSQSRGGEGAASHRGITY